MTWGGGVEQLPLSAPTQQSRKAALGEARLQLLVLKALN
jgi:hypothetical protein